MRDSATGSREDHPTSVLAAVPRAYIAAAVADLYACHHPGVRRYISRSVADVEADVWLRLLKTRSPFEGRASERTWVLSIARGAIAQYWRQRARHEGNSDASDVAHISGWQTRVRWDELEDLPSVAAGPHALVEQREVLASLDTRAVAAATLVTAHGATWADAARKVGVSTSFLRRLRRQAREAAR